MRIRALPVLAALSLAAACGTDAPTGPQLPATFSGTIEVRNGTTIPANARVLVLWGVSATSPDYSYVYGTGTVGANGTFTITLPAVPPDAALNLNQVGVGLVILTTDQNLAEGMVPSGYAYPGLIGLSENHSIIFTRNLSPDLSAKWYGRFDGYGLGEVERSTTGFDTFKVAAPNTLEIVVDAMANIRPPNWT
ncbi:MAG TPA: hypothetical protein VFO55_09495 [Gemmatimonadaceae bacterium]|nr:hypothetical protein [Gemmatimonadaceae bacterium]